MQTTISALTQTSGHPVKTTNKYKHINSTTIVDKLQSMGWLATQYREASTKKYQGYQRHSVQFKAPDTSLLKVGDSEIRIIMTNNHMGSGCLTLSLGLFRLVCSNGLVVSDSVFESLKVRHSGVTVEEQVEQFVERIAASANRLHEVMRQMRSVTLSSDAIRQLAKQALDIRNVEVTEEKVDNVISIRRSEDASNDVWSVFNRVQENIIRGTHGLRRITSVKRDFEINKKLFDLFLKAA